MMVFANSSWLSVLVATVMLTGMVRNVQAGRFKLPVKILDCAGNPVPNAVVKISNCVEADTFATTNEDGMAVFDRYNPGGGRDKVIDYCAAAASRECHLEVQSSAVLEGSVYDAYVLPKSPRQRVQETCNCAVCREAPGNNKECPPFVGLDGCPGRSGRKAAKSTRRTGPVIVPPTGPGNNNGLGPRDKMVVLRPRSCVVEYTKSECTFDGSRCGVFNPSTGSNFRGAYCENTACLFASMPQPSYFFCSFGGVPGEQLTLSFACPAEGLLDVTVSAAKASDVDSSCGLQGNDNEKLVIRKLVNDVVQGDFAPAADHYIVETGLPCDPGTVYTVTEDVGVILQDSISAVFYPSAQSTP